MENVNSKSQLPLNVLILLFDRIALHVPLSGVICLSQTHPTLISKLSPHLHQSIDELLASRISRTNVSGFRTLLLKTRAAISGSTALHFILRETRWKPGDFDLYAPFGTGYTIVHWLIQREGYRLISDGARSFIFHPHTVTAPPGPCRWTTELIAASSVNRGRSRKYHSTDSDIYRVYKLCSTNNTYVDVIESSKPSFLPPITRFHSTIVMNYLTPDSIVVLYPKLTFKREGILQYRDENTLDSYDNPNEPLASNDNHAIAMKQDYVQKYKSRGFTLFSRPADLLRPCGAACPSLRRTDQMDSWALCLRIPLSDSASSQMGVTDPVGSPGLSDAFLTGNLEDGVLVPSISSSALSSQQPPSSSWASSYITSFSDEFSRMSIAAENSTTQCLFCTRPPLPETQWVLQAPPSLNEGENRRRRKRGVCRNPFCHFQGVIPGLYQYNPT